MSEGTSRSGMRKVCPVELIEKYQKGHISSGHFLRSQLFQCAQTASTPDELEKMRQALAKVPRMAWLKEHQAVLKNKGLL